MCQVVEATGASIFHRGNRKCQWGVHPMARGKDEGRRQRGERRVTKLERRRPRRLRLFLFLPEMVRFLMGVRTKVLHSGPRKEGRQGSQKGKAKG